MAYDVLWDSRADLGIWESFAFMRVRSSFLAAFRACGVAIGGLSEESGAREGGIGMVAMVFEAMMWWKFRTLL